MKKVLLLFVILVILLGIFTFLNNNNPQSGVSLILSHPDTKSAKLIYRVSLFGIIPVAEAEFSPARVEVYDGGEVYHLSATAKNLKIFSRFFQGQALLDSYVDMGTLSPIKFKEKVSLKGRQDAEKEITYNQAGRVMSISGIRREIPPKTQDPLSAIYNIRRMDFARTTEFQMNINTNQKNYTLNAKARLKDVLAHNETSRAVFLDAEIFRQDKSPYHKTLISMVLAGKDNVPVLIKVFASGILINIKLVDIR